MEGDRPKVSQESSSSSNKVFDPARKRIAEKTELDKKQAKEKEEAAKGYLSHEILVDTKHNDEQHQLKIKHRNQRLREMR